MIDPRLSRLATRADYLDAGEERDLLQRAKAGEQAARDRLVITHTRLAIAGAMQFRHFGVSVDDLTHEGIAGLLTAIDSFDLDQEARFGTYARWWVRAKIADYVLRQSGPIAFATSAAGRAMFFRLRAERAKLERTGTLSPAEVEARLAEVFGVAVDRVRSAIAYLANGNVSLNEPMTPDGDERGALLADEAEAQDVIAEVEIDGPHRRNTLRFALARLDDRERAIVTERHMAEEDGATLEALGRRFGISKERVRQIETRALGKLKALLNADGTERRKALATI